MAHTDEEKLVISAMRDSDSYDKDNYYLFFFNSGTNTKINGYMPFKSHFGFIFKNDQYPGEFMRTIAHELAHGPYRLRHTFSNKNKYVQPQGSTTNLMDYVDDNKAATAVELQKYQWDEIHSWNLGANWLEEGEEAESSGLLNLKAALQQIGANACAFCKTCDDSKLLDQVTINFGSKKYHCILGLLKDNNTIESKTYNTTSTALTSSSDISIPDGDLPFVVLFTNNSTPIVCQVEKDI